jgi:hypothetical protein
MINLSNNQQKLLNRALFGIGLGATWTGNSLRCREIGQCVDGSLSNFLDSLPKYVNREEWIRDRLHYLLIRLRLDVNYFRKNIPEVQKIQDCIAVALRLTGTNVRMTETETLSLLETL